MKYNVIAFAIGIVFLSFAMTACQAQGGINPGDQAPEIEASSWYNNNGPVTLESLRGKVVVVEFWATWCPPCLDSIPHLNEIHDAYQDKGVVIIGLSNENAFKVGGFIDKMNMRYIVGAGSNNGSQYGVSGIPTAFVLNTSGTVVWRGHPMNDLESAIDTALKKTPPGDAGSEKDESSSNETAETALEEVLTITPSDIGADTATKASPSGSDTKEPGEKKGNTMNPTVIMETSLGSVTIELWPDKAPITVKNFLRYVDEGHYEETIFHRVMANFMIQGGGFTANMKQKDNHDPIKNEARKDVGNKRGTLAMARTSVVDSATAQFFINVVDNDFLTHTSKTPRGYGYCVFGEVIDGMDVVDKIRKVKTTNKGGHQNVPAEPVVIKSMKQAE